RVLFRSHGDRGGLRVVGRRMSQHTDVVAVESDAVEVPVKKKGRNGPFFLDVTDYREIVFPPTKTEDEWAKQGKALGHAERVLGLVIGAWWNDGEKYGRRVEIVTGPDW